MNFKNALGFLILGLVMYTTPLLAHTLSNHSAAIVDSSVRSLWVQFMSWVIGGIGLGYLMREAAVRIPAIFSTERLLHPVESRGTDVQLPVGARIVIPS